ncbi:MAG: ribosomal-processing cysteine protease Prp [Firmicutes bacterium]|nr:ribosomal-processing cysteine protease Prp [Bacillota bacterium]
MIKIVLWRHPTGDPARLTMTGHADAGPYGQDIVCAAASALAETLALGLKKVVPGSGMGRVDAGAVDLQFVSPLAPDARAVIETICVGFADLAHSEPQYVRWSEKFLS